MSKIENLQHIKTHVEVGRHSFVRPLLYQQLEDPELSELHLRMVGQATLLLEEISDHLTNLHGIETACRHGLAGTEPDEYADLGYEADTEEAMGQDPATRLPYCPYQDILCYLQGAESVTLMTLSLGLLHFIEGLPGQMRQQAATYRAGGITLCHVNDDGSTRPMTEQELVQYSERNFVETMEQTLFTASWEQDMYRIRRLALAQGDLQEILGLL